jgi:hypothetical protein
LSAPHCLALGPLIWRGCEIFAAFVKYNENKNVERIRLGWLHRPIRFVTRFKERSILLVNQVTGEQVFTQFTKLVVKVLLSRVLILLNHPISSLVRSVLIFQAQLKVTNSHQIVMS